MTFTANRLIVAGNLTRDPELRQISPERTVANFSLAINQRSRGADGEAKESVIFLDCEAWGRTAELVSQYLTKGSGAYIEGRLKQDTWADKTTGEKRSKIKVVAEIVRFTGSPRGHGDAGSPAADGAEAMEDGEPAATPPPAATGATARPRTGTSASLSSRPAPRPRVSAPATPGPDEEPPF